MKTPPLITSENACGAALCCSVLFFSKKTAPLGGGVRMGSLGSLRGGVLGGVVLHIC